MNSEKVKEIKKGLEERTQHKPINCSHSEYVEACGMYCRHHREFVADMGIKNGQTCENCSDFIATDKVKEYADILTLINELECENEKLKQHKRELQGGQRDLSKAIKEFDKENQQLKDRIVELEEYIKGNEQDAKAFVNGWHKDLKTELKQFAERLIEKKVKLGDRFNIYDIDETLKECLCEKQV